MTGFVERIQTKNCEWLNSEFDNILIPDKIKNRDKDEVQILKKWAEENKSLFISDREAFKARCCMKFKLIYPDDLIDISFKNSGNNEFKDYNLEDLDKKIEDLISDAIEFRNSTTKNKEILEEFKDKIFLRSKEFSINDKKLSYPENEIRETISSQYEQFNQPLILMLQEWLRIAINPDLKFEESLLTQLGFEKCRRCFP